MSDDDGDEILTPLHAAVDADDLVRVQALVAAGADIEEKQSNNGPTPLCRAAEKGYITMARSLVERGANIEATSIVGRTPLIIAVQHRYIEVVRIDGAPGRGPPPF